MEFKDRLTQRMKDLGLKATDVAKLAGVSRATVSFWTSGTNLAKGENLVRLAESLKCTPEWLTDGVVVDLADVIKKRDLTGISYEKPARGLGNAEMLGPISVWDDQTPLDDDEVYVPFLKEVELSAGSGKAAVEKSSSRKLRFGKITLRNVGVQFENAVCVTVHGNSMEPVLPDGSTVGVDMGNKQVKDGKMYALDHNGELRVKTLYRVPNGGMRLRSFNRDEFDDEVYTAEQLEQQNISVVGKVFWYSVLV